MKQKDYAVFILLCGVAASVLIWPDTKFRAVALMIPTITVAWDYYSNKPLTFQLHHAFSILIIGICIVEVYQVLKYLL